MAEIRKVQGGFFNGALLNFLSTRSHVNWLRKCMGAPVKETTLYMFLQVETNAKTYNTQLKCSFSTSSCLLFCPRFHLPNFWLLRENLKKQTTTKNTSLQKNQGPNIFFFPFFSLNRSRGLSSLVVAMFVCVFVCLSVYLFQLIKCGLRTNRNSFNLPSYNLF